MANGHTPTAEGFPECPAHSYWYRCSNGFAGCCSVDPCNSTGCPESSQGKSSSSTSSSSTDAKMTMNPTQPPAMGTVGLGDAGDSSAAPPSSTPSTTAHPPSSSSSSSSLPPPPSPTDTTSAAVDSGITHTIPNDSTVTVTRHTTITRSLPPTTTDTSADFTTDATQSSTIQSEPSPTLPPTETPVTNGPSNSHSGGSINVGTVVGIAVGGVFVAALVIALWYLWRSRRNRASRNSDTGAEAAILDKSGLHDNILGYRRGSAVLPRHPTPHQASNGRGYSYDPFAPFGGRADQTSTSPPPPADTFEMDGRGIEVAELPGTAVTTSDAVELADHKEHSGSVGAVKQRPCLDPRATLNHLPRENGRPTYINQWNQYKSQNSEVGYGTRHG